MLSRATGLFSVYRGTTTNDSGDTVDDNTDPLYVDIPLGLRNSASPLSESPNTNSPRTISPLVGRASSDQDLLANDRLQDQYTGLLYVIDWVRAPYSSTRNSDLEFGLHRVN